MRKIASLLPADRDWMIFLGKLIKSTILCCFCLAAFGCNKLTAKAVVTWHNDYAINPPVKSQAMWADQLRQPWARTPPLGVLRIKVSPRRVGNYPIAHDIGHQAENLKSSVDTCEKLFSANEKSLGPVPIELGAYQYMALKCYIAKAVYLAKSAKVSYLGKWVLNNSTVKQLPPQLAFVVSNDDKSIVYRAEAKHKSLGSMLSNAEITSKAVDDNHHVIINNGVSIQELALVARGDFNGDGVEDLLVASENHLSGGRYRQYGLYVVTRLKKGGSLILAKTYPVMTSGM